MNKKLIFSWAHILALMAAMFFGYMAFLGSAYRSSGNMTEASIFAAVMVLGALGACIYLQSLKATDHDFHKRIWIERVLLYALPVIILLLTSITGVFSYINIVSHKEGIEQNYQSALNNAGEMFVEYEAATTARIQAFENAAETGEVEFRTSPGCPIEIQKGNMREMLAQQISFENSELATFRSQVHEYLGQDPDIDNVAVLANIAELQAHVNEWYQFLQSTYQNRFSFEPESNDNARFIYVGKEALDENLIRVQTSISESGFKLDNNSLLYIFLVLLCIGVLYLPWVAQARHSRNDLTDKKLREHYKADARYPIFTIK